MLLQRTKNALRHVRDLITLERLSRSAGQRLKPQNVVQFLRGIEFADSWRAAAGFSACGPEASTRNALRDRFEAHREGPGIWKFWHYFDIYQRHLAKFVGREVHVAEVGIFSGGSLSLWREYFGSQSRIYGVDIQEQCRAYENDYTKIYIGDQADRRFWKRFRDEVPALDVLIDDGGHTPEQQRVTLEEVLPHLRPGGVYLCEDISGVANGFTAFVAGLDDALNAFKPQRDEALLNAAQISSRATPFQSAVHSIHHYPIALVIERTDRIVGDFVAPKHGTQWAPPEWCYSG